MICAWKEFLGVVPEWMRCDVDRLARTNLEELRLRYGKVPELVLGDNSIWLNRAVSEEDLKFCINAGSRYSPWASETVSSGYITAIGGHRIGLCGEAAVRNGEVRSIRTPTSLCIRVARDFPGIAEALAQKTGSLLILGVPGGGKTTLLRDLIRQISNKSRGSVAVVDERGELFPVGSYFNSGKRTDVLTGCGKRTGIDMVLRTMGPAVIAVDEITAESDCEALLRASYSGVRLLATAHASNMADLRSRSVYRKLLEYQLFSYAVVLQRDRTWKLERMVS